MKPWHCKHTSLHVAGDWAHAGGGQPWTHGAFHPAGGSAALVATAAHG